MTPDYTVSVLSDWMKENTALGRMWNEAIDPRHTGLLITEN
jgi:hypothetical protein